MRASVFIALVQFLMVQRFEQVNKYSCDGIHYLKKTNSGKTNSGKIRPLKFHISLDKSTRDKESKGSHKACRRTTQFMLLKEGQSDFAPEVMVKN